VTAADGTSIVPHAQHWRALLGQGRDVRIAGFVLWSPELEANQSQPFPADPRQDVRFRVSASGSIQLTVRAADGAPVQGSAVAMLRWLDAPPEPDEPDDVPELLIGVRPGAGALAIPGIPLGHWFELVLQGVPGWVDPRLAFNGPRTRGEAVRVELVIAQRAAAVSGRLVDESGEPLANRLIEAWIERSGGRVEAEGDELVTDDEGRFHLELPPVDGAATLVLLATYTTIRRGPDREYSFAIRAGEETARPRARHEFARGLTAGEHDLGDVRCQAPKAAGSPPTPR
jgi:hypothetical protein